MWQDVCDNMCISLLCVLHHVSCMPMCRHVTTNHVVCIFMHLHHIHAVALLLWTYQNHALYADRARLCYGLLQFEQATLLWRIRHARMVELFIGRKMGTGGSSGKHTTTCSASDMYACHAAPCMSTCAMHVTLFHTDFPAQQHMETTNSVQPWINMSRLTCHVM